MILTIFTIIGRVDIYKESPLLERIFDGIQFTSELIFVAMCLIGTAFERRKNWKELFDIIKNLEEKFSTENVVIKKEYIFIQN
ncbi:hypothetical protein NQ314_012175 [Rhamnusium bicolor]|uniref:Uncharacterized protein n=1 Tax=Rhamnusium bicolor TaxID=1586634 RepID=A0AAV8XDP2_9CUCU|nr:hypothetical protein NQ314_012175 [Rhamnusium bicolor]